MGLLNSFPLTLLDQLEPNLLWMFLRVSCIELLSKFFIHLKTWSLLLKIEQRIQTVVFRIYLQNRWVKPNFGLSKSSTWWDLSKVRFSFPSVKPCWSYCPFFTFFWQFLMLFLSIIFSSDTTRPVEPNLVRMFLGISCIELMWGLLIHQKTWLPLLKKINKGQ